MRRLLFGLGLTLLLSSGFARSQDAREFPSTSGNAFVRFCSAIEKGELTTREDLRNTVACVAYVEGVVQGVNVEIAYSKTTTGNEPNIPLPDTAENGQIVKVTLKYIRNHPEEAHKPTASLQLEALREAFPCHSKKP
jgi:Rap1a immunity proteins